MTSHKTDAKETSVSIKKNICFGGKLRDSHGSKKSSSVIAYRVQMRLKRKQSDAGLMKAVSFIPDDRVVCL